MPRKLNKNRHHLEQSIESYCSCSCSCSCTCACNPASSPPYSNATNDTIFDANISSRSSSMQNMRSVAFVVINPATGAC
ncbi:MAG: CLI_3235 family bacteriocin precursor [Defluviitaleaceae bacterium]|nr:CLI_3235 family bacteriocin precursor [Defluviitaleaceae bacterium]